MGARSFGYLLLIATATILVGACSDSPTWDDPISAYEPTLLLSVLPAAGAINVSVGTDLEIRFDHGLPAMMQDFVALHVGDCPGPIVDGMWSFTADGMGLRFTPDTPLMPGTEYSFHVGGGMTDTFGMPIDLAQHGIPMGGHWATEDMVRGPYGMGTGMGMGLNGTGQPIVDHTGAGWGHSNGTYGLVFSFTTAG